MDHTKLIQAAIAFDHGDAKRIQHFLKVYAFASLIGKMEGLAPETQAILEAAAILHDIGIHAAEKKYGSTAGRYQEIEGPAPARLLMQQTGTYPEDFQERVAFLIAHHHTYTDVDRTDWQILLEADFLVNAYEDHLSATAIRACRQKIFRTSSGQKLLDDNFNC
jgi:hypothetical protein